MVSAIIEKIRGLFRLSKDPCNEYEAALAAERVRDLLAKYNLSLGEVLNERTEGMERAGRRAARTQPHFPSLARACALLFDVEWFIDSLWSGQRNARGRVISHAIVFCGIEQNVDAALLTLEYFDDAIRSLLLKRSIRSARRRMAYKRGAATRLGFEAAKLKYQSEESASAETLALVRVGNAVAKRQLLQHRLHSRPTAAPRVNQAFVAGFLDAGQVPLHGAARKRVNHARA